MTRSVREMLSYAPLLLAIAGCSSAAAAESGTSSNQTTLAASAGTPTADAPPPPHHKPPQAAFDACKGASEGAACSVTFGDHTMSGTCRKGPNGEGDLACAPDHPPGPPPEAVEACKSAAEGDACHVTLHGETFDGTCRKGPDGNSTLACAPPHPPGSAATDPDTHKERLAAARSASDALGDSISAEELEQTLDLLESSIQSPNGRAVD